MLQEQFNETVFAAEKRLLKSEGIEVDDSALQSSAQRLGLMTRVLTTLDEQCRLGERASDEEFLQIVGNTIATPRILKLEQAGTFSISHYAGKVFYVAEGFVMKNTDTMPEEMSSLLLSCDGLGMIHEALQTKLDIQAGKEPGGKKGGDDGGPKKEEAKAAAPAKMSMADRIAAMQKGNSDDKPAPGPMKKGVGGKKAPPLTLGGRLRNGIE